MLDKDFGTCGRCYDTDVEIFLANCTEKPEDVHGPVGMYHCPDCGAMIIAGVYHLMMCKPCLERNHPLFDKTP